MDIGPKTHNIFLSTADFAEASAPSAEHPIQAGARFRERFTCLSTVDGDLGPIVERDSPETRPVQPPEIGSVVAVRQAGGLHHRYERRAA